MSGESVSSTVSGRVIEANFGEGMRVKKGDILIRLDTTRLDFEIAALTHTIESNREELTRLQILQKNLLEEREAALLKTRREIKEARAGVDREIAKRSAQSAKLRLAELEAVDAKGKWKELRDLVNDGLEPREKLREASRAHRLASARVEAARKGSLVAHREIQLGKARLETVLSRPSLVEKDYAKRAVEIALRINTKEGQIASALEKKKNYQHDRGESVIRAHTDGVVTSGHPRVGDMIQPGKPVLAIAQEKGFRVDVGVPAAEVGLLRVGMKARVKFDAFDYRDYGAMEGVVYFISPDSQAVDMPGGGQGAMYIVKVRLPGDELVRKGRRGKIKLGLTAQVEFLTGHERITGLLFRKVREKVSLD